MRLIFVPLIFFHWISTSFTTDMEVNPTQNLHELQRSFRQGLLLYPNSKKFHTIEQEWSHPRLKQRKWPVILYLHGCAGLGPYEKKDLLLFAKQGALLIAPNSFGRKSKPMSCDPKISKGGLHREVIHWRIAEAEFALKQISSRKLASRVLLAGFSEGAITTARFPPPDSSNLYDGKLILGWTCHAYWPEYKGLQATKDLPVLSVVADRDPWFRSAQLLGSCHRFMKNTPRQRGIVVYGEKHWVTMHPGAKPLIFPFIQSVLYDSQKPEEN